MTAPRDGDERPWLVLASEGPPLAALVDVPPVQLEIPTEAAWQPPMLKPLGIIDTRSERWKAAEARAGRAVMRGENIAQADLDVIDEEQATTPRTPTSSPPCSAEPRTASRRPGLALAGRADGGAWCRAEQHPGCGLRPTELPRAPDYFAIGWTRERLRLLLDSRRRRRYACSVSSRRGRTKGRPHCERQCPTWGVVGSSSSAPLRRGARSLTARSPGR